MIISIHTDTHTHTHKNKIYTNIFVFVSFIKIILLKLLHYTMFVCMGVFVSSCVL
jgi:hypothetical protein